MLGIAPDVFAHSPALVAGVIADRNVRQSAATGNARKGRQRAMPLKIDRRNRFAVPPGHKDVVQVIAVADAVAVDVVEGHFAVGPFAMRLDYVQMAVVVPIFARVEKAVAVRVFATFDRHGAELAEAGENLFPGAPGRMEDADEHQKAEHGDDFERHHPLQHFIDLAAKDQWQHPRKKTKKANPRISSQSSSSRHPPQPERGQRRGGTRRQIGNDTADVEHQVEITHSRGPGNVRNLPLKIGSPE